MKTVTWNVTLTRPIACPDYQPDPYTGEYPSTHCLVYHSEIVTEGKSVSFVTEEEAREFIRKAPESCTDFKINGETIANTHQDQAA